METAVTAENPTPTKTTDADTGWGINAPAVRAALKFIKRRKQVTAEELVEWDRAHGGRLFTWTDTQAAESWRLQQARLFLNSFRRQIDGMRVRSFIHVREDDNANIKESAYFTVEAIAQHAGMRAQVIRDITRRMTSLGTELSMWQLTADEQTALFDKLRAAIAGSRQRNIA